jgi:hypothetical protein
MAKSVLLSDHHYSRAELEGFSNLITSGKPAVYDAASISQYGQAMEGH